jgi:glycosyltransferase involved in cell wall biosynthesis
VKILYVSQYFPPEMGAPAARVSELARHWAAAGHDVTVLTGFPNHPDGRVHSAYQAKLRRLTVTEQVGAVKVVRTWLIPLPNRSSHERILNYTSFCLSSLARGLFLKRPDVIIATSPQLLVGLSGWVLGKLRRAPFVFEVRDLWPDAILASGVGRADSLFARSLSALSGFLYANCDHCVVVSPAFKSELLEKWGVSADSVSVVQNGVETDLFVPAPDSAAAKRSVDLEGRFVVSYVGTLGFAHGLESILGAAELLRRDLPQAVFLLVGEGADRERLVQQAQARHLDNIRFLGQQPRQRIPDIVAASDVCLVLLKKAEVFKTVIPTKLLEFMACARPVLLGVDGQARSVLEEAGGGIYVEPEDITALTSAIQYLHKEDKLRDELGRRGRDYIVRNLSRRRTADDYMRVMDNLLGAQGEEAQSAAL